jgi:Class II Aldolase and Adducin N-terminal domain
METGAVKFRYESSGKELTPFAGFEELNAARQELRRMNLIGVDQHGVGFGNVSLRDGATESFYITGSGTGGLPVLTLREYAKVVAWDFERNWLRCDGLTVASAESLTHAAVYATAPEAGVVVHGHNQDLWRSLIEQGISTEANVAYGTPEMARQVQRLLRETSVRTRGIFAMAGHDQGIVVFGPDFSRTLSVLATARAFLERRN